MNLRPSYFYFFVITSLFFAACSSDDEAIDNKPPTVSNVTLNELTEDIVVEAGSTVHFDAQFTDDVLLGEYKIDIHDNFDGHSHGRLASTIFTFSQIYPLIGKTETVHQDIDIPEDATPGLYHFSLQFIDSEGNEGEIVTLTFEIADPSNQPVINITSPDFSSEIEVAPGGSIVLIGYVEDPDGLEEVHIQLVRVEEDHSHGKTTEEILFEEEILVEGATTWNFENIEAIEIPESVEADHYELKITAEDVLGNVKTVSADVHVE